MTRRARPDTVALLAMRDDEHLLEVPEANDDRSSESTTREENDT